MGQFAVLIPLLLIILAIVTLIIVIKVTKKNEQTIINEFGEVTKIGLGGWLILVGFGVLISPFFFFGTLATYLSIINDGSYKLLTDQSSIFYIPYWREIFFFELSVTLCFGFASAFNIFLFFKKKKLFPKLFIYLHLLGIVYILVDAFLVKLILPDEPMWDPDTIKELLRALISAGIWVPYMLVSRRVAGTFTN